MAGSDVQSQNQCRRRSLALLVALLAIQQQVRLSAADVSSTPVVRQPGKIAVDPTAGYSSGSGENELNTKGQLTNAGTNAPSGPAMLNGQKVTSANLNQSTKKTTTATPATATTATPVTATATPVLITAQPASAQTLVSSALGQQQESMGGMFTSVNGASTAAQFVQQASAAAGTRSAAAQTAAGRSISSSGGQLSGAVTSVVGGRRMMLMVTPLHVVSP